MEKYEYNLEQISVELKSIFVKNKEEYSKMLEDKLNARGQEGWELAGVDGTWFYFKRKL